MQLVFDTSVEDKPETPGEVPDPEKGGLGGARPLGMSTSSSSPTLPRPPEHPPPPPPTVTKKPSMPAPAPPPKLDQEVSFSYMRVFYISTLLNEKAHVTCDNIICYKFCLLRYIYLSVFAFDVKI